MAEIDKYSLSTVPVQQFFRDTDLKGHATAFVWFEHGNSYLITNWHVVTLIDPNTGEKLHSMGARPDRLKAQFNPSRTEWWKHEVELPLYDSNDCPLWLVHPVHRRKVDVIALPLQPAPPHINYYPINRMKQADDLAVAVSMDVFALGYPFEFKLPGFPIWKRGSIVSEPQLAPLTDRYFLVDSAARPGMSGAPVVLRSWGVKVGQGFVTSMTAGPATKFIGVYSGRLHTKDIMETQLGMVWPADLISEIIAGRNRDDTTR